MKPYGIKCIVPSCGNKMSKNRSISYFSFPKDDIRCKKWIENSKIGVDIEVIYKKQLKVCGEHFETKMFLNDLKNRLQPHAIPTLFNAECLTPDIMQKSASVLTTTDTLAVEIPDFSPVLNSSLSSDFTLDSPSPGASSSCSSKSVQTPLKLRTNNTPRKILLRQQLKAEKESRLQAAKSIISLSNQLADLVSSENFLKECETHRPGSSWCFDNC